MHAWTRLVTLSVVVVVHSLSLIVICGQHFHLHFDLVEQTPVCLRLVRGHPGEEKAGAVPHVVLRAGTYETETDVFRESAIGKNENVRTANHVGWFSFDGRELSAFITYLLQFHLISW